MNLEQLITKYIENAMQYEKYQDNDEDYKKANRCYEKSLELEVLIEQFLNWKEPFEKLLNHNNDYVVLSVAFSLVYSSNSKDAIKAIERIAVRTDSLGKEAKGFLERYRKGQVTNKFILEKKKKILEKIKRNKNYKIDSVNEMNDKETGAVSKKSSEMVEYRIPIVTTNYENELNAHFRKIFPESNFDVIEDPNDYPMKIDINVLKPANNEDFYVLYTTGMSGIPMNVPKTLFNKFGKYKHAELTMLVPSNWGDNYEDKKWQSVLNLLRFLAYFPHFNNTWLSAGHSVGELKKEIPNFDFDGVVLYCQGIVKTNLKTKINVYIVVPVYQEEMEYKLKYGHIELIKKLEKEDEKAIVLKLKRRNVMK